MAKKSYSERLARYEQEKTRLQRMKLSPDEYQKLLREAAKKWRI